MPAENGNGSNMPSVGAAPGQKCLNIDDTTNSTESKRQQTELSDDESIVIGDDNVADMENAGDDGFEVVPSPQRSDSGSSRSDYGNRTRSRPQPILDPAKLLKTRLMGGTGPVSAVTGL
ncbi:hypothetical protein HPB50_014106 [Hyalomma asiaticum]|uniref:Uncharacterized protein n=1 Tax=Hyalomma asiaticum TaxID=266040 RepID=A0ACB7T9U6_HYAAI|nr:hypothetical protein HPB50_014106 [Hyalomma asiaticum]